MARRLSEQQKRRIALHQQRKRDAVSAGGPADRNGAAADVPAGEDRHGLVVAHYGSQLDVEVTDGDDAGELRRCFLRANIEPLVTGDLVIWREGETAPVVVAGCARHSLLSRPDMRGVLRPVAANVDTMIVVIAPRPQPHANLVDRYLVAAAQAGIAPLLLCNKLDLLVQLDAAECEALQALLAMYRDVGVPVLELCAHNGAGLDALRDHLQGKTCVVVGQSGVGKSSLVKALLPEIAIGVGELSEAVDKGKHTTTTARLYHLPSLQAQLIDSPGIREFTLGHVPPRDLLHYFPDLHRHALLCRFRDCSHTREPGCALLAAVDCGEVHPARLESYRQILASLAES